MYYSEYTIGGELFHSVTGKAYKYIDKVRTKSGKWRYIYDDKGNKKAYKISDAKEKSKHNYNQYLAPKDGVYFGKNMRQFRRFSKIGFEINYSRLSDKELDEEIKRCKEAFENQRNKVNETLGDEFIKKDVSAILKARKEKQLSRMAMDEYEQRLYLLERERDNRKNGVKFGRRR